MVCQVAGAQGLVQSFGRRHADVATVGGAQGGRSHGWGWCTIKQSDRDHAIEQLNGTDWDGRTIEVRIDEKQAGNGGVYVVVATAAVAATAMNMPYVGNLPWSCDWKMLKDSFSCTPMSSMLTWRPGWGTRSTLLWMGHCPVLQQAVS